MSYVLPRNAVDVAALFQIMEARKAEGGIKEFGLSECSLEEVFIKVVTAAESEQADIEAARLAAASTGPSTALLPKGEGQGEALV